MHTCMLSYMGPCGYHFFLRKHPCGYHCDMVIIFCLNHTRKKKGDVLCLSYFAACDCSTLDVKSDRYICDWGLGVLINKKGSKFA